MANTTDKLWTARQTLGAVDIYGDLRALRLAAPINRKTGKRKRPDFGFNPETKKAHTQESWLAAQVAQRIDPYGAARGRIDMKLQNITWALEQYGRRDLAIIPGFTALEHAATDDMQMLLAAVGQYIERQDAARAAVQS